MRRATRCGFSRIDRRRSGGRPRRRHRSHTGIDSCDNHVFRLNEPSEKAKSFKAICSMPAGIRELLPGIFRSSRICRKAGHMSAAGGMARRRANRSASASTCTPSFLIKGFSQLSELWRAKQKSTRYAGGKNLLYKKHLSHTIELFKPIVIFKRKVFLYGNSSSKFSSYKMVVQVSHCLFSKIQAENNICQYSRKYRRNF